MRFDAKELTGIILEHVVDELEVPRERVKDVTFNIRETGVVGRFNVDVDVEIDTDGTGSPYR